MTTAFLDIHDTGIQVALQGELSSISPPSPGLALFDGGDGGRVEVGIEAARRARLEPRRLHSRFWERLDTAPLERPFPRTLKHADLAHAHLQSVWRPFRQRASRALVAVPSWYSDEQLGLLLSLLQTCGVPVSELVDGAVAAVNTVREPAASPEPPEARRRLYLDLHLHRAVAVGLEIGDSATTRRVSSLDEVGLLPLTDRLAKRVAELFVRQTRFDPLHAAGSEQQLYDRLPDWLERLRHRPHIVATLDTGKRQHSAEIDLETLLPILEPALQLLVELARGLEPPTATPAPGALLSHRLAVLPGLEGRLRKELGAGVLALPPGATLAGLVEAAETLAAEPGHHDDGGVPFLTHLRPPRAPLRSTEQPAPAAAGLRAEQGADDAPPTHLLYGDLAVPLADGVLTLGSDPSGEGGRQLVVGRQGEGVARRHCRIRREGDSVLVEDLGRCGTFLNETAVLQPTAARLGDRLRLGEPGVAVRFIRVESAGGS